MTKQDGAYALRIFYGYTSSENVEEKQGEQLNFQSQIKDVRSFGCTHGKHCFAMLLHCPKPLRFFDIDMPDCEVLGEQVVQFSPLPPLNIDGHIIDTAFLQKNLRKRRMEIPNALKKRFRKEKHRTLTEFNWKRFIKVKRLHKLCMAN